MTLGKWTVLLDNLEAKVTDFHFNLKQSLVRSSNQENVISERRSSKISRDIVLFGIDNRTLDAFGRWPFPRSTHAKLLTSLTRIQKQNDRESAILLDILFNDIADNASEDIIFINSIKENGRVLLQNQLFAQPFTDDRNKDSIQRFSTLLENYGELTNIEGNLENVSAYYGLESPLSPYGKAITAYGHASFRADRDAIYRRQQLVARYGEKVGELPWEELEVGFNFKGFSSKERGHLGWIDKGGFINSVELPLSEESYKTLESKIFKDGVPRIDKTGNMQWYLSIYKDHYIPAIPLSLALQYFNKSLDDVEVVYGSHIRIPNPTHWNPETGSWEPYSVGNRPLNEIRIPIDDNGNMQINFMGQRSSADPRGMQTFPVRSYSAYAQNIQNLDPATWPKTKKLGGKVIMVGAFTSGMADDEKNTPLGLMFGVEMHANALNTILMNNFIIEAPEWVNALSMFVLLLGIAILTSRIKSIGWSAFILVLFTISSFIAVSFIFEYMNILFDWVSPILGLFITYISVVIYRVFTAERDKKLIKDVFGQFISPTIVDELSETPPELGGEDVDVTMFFSDIRGFSRISERLSAQELVHLLNEYLTDMTNNLVNDFNGTLDKYIGDAIMAFWGAPRIQEDHAVRACKCAIMQTRLLENLNTRLKAQSGDLAQTLSIGIGLNSGTCMVGYMGSEGRKNYTAMGDTVNLASRLEGVNKTYKTSIIISEDTRKRVKHEPFIVRELDEIYVKGRTKPVGIYELLDYEGDILS